MAEFLKINDANASVGDTFKTLVIKKVVDAANGVYIFSDIASTISGSTTTPSTNLADLDLKLDIIRFDESQLKQDLEIDKKLEASDIDLTTKEDKSNLTTSIRVSTNAEDTKYSSEKAIRTELDKRVLKPVNSADANKKVVVNETGDDIKFIEDSKEKYTTVANEQELLALQNNSTGDHALRQDIDVKYIYDGVSWVPILPIKAFQTRVAGNIDIDGNVELQDLLDLVVAKTGLYQVFASSVFIGVDDTFVSMRLTLDGGIVGDWLVMNPLSGENSISNTYGATYAANVSLILQLTTGQVLRTRAYHPTRNSDGQIATQNRITIKEL